MTSRIGLSATLRCLAAAAIVSFVSTSARAETTDCPAFYRFVDFGIRDDDGSLYRGGPVFRAEDFDGTPLLFTRSTVCEDVADLAKDGRGNPIPVVSKIAYDRRTADPALGWIEVASADDAVALATTTAGLHFDRLTQDDVPQIRGDSYLCAAPSIVSFSCQIVSPYPTDAPVVVYCEDGECLTFAIAMTDRLVIAASWPMQVQSVEWQAEDIITRLGAIADFLAPISSGL